MVCLPGGPMQDSAYLGDLSAHRQLILLDLRGTGQSAIPEDPTSYRCDRLVDDVDALRGHLGLDRMDLLAHSAGANLAALFVERHPGRVSKLALITPSTMAVGISITGDLRRETAQRRRDEPWFPAAFSALEAIVAGEADDDSWQAIAPFYYGRWDETARAHRAAEDQQKNQEPAAVFGAEGAFDPDATRTALATGGIQCCWSPGRSIWPPLLARWARSPGCFRTPGSLFSPEPATFPWLDDADRFVTTTASFLG